MISFHRKKYDYDLIVIGSGGGGNVGAYHARSLGKKVAIFEKGDIGGECPTWACVPTKALLHAGDVYHTVQNSRDYGVHVKDITVNFHEVKAWKDLVVSRTGAAQGEGPFRKEGITLIREHANFISPHEVEAGGKTYSAAKFLIATGSKVFIPPIEGIKESGYITFDKAVDMKEIPKSILIFGGGPVGCEFAHHFARFRSKVTIVNRSERLLGNEDTEVQDIIQAIFENEDISVLTNSSIVKIEKKGDKKVVHLKKGETNITREVDEVLIATGKVASLDFAPEKAGIRITDHKLRVNRFLQTNVSHIFAAGDIVGPFQFTHTANYQSYLATRNAFANKKIPADYSVVPRCVFVSPEVASVGISERQALEKGIPIMKGMAPIAVVGRANTANQFDGFIKVITDKSGVIIGASIVAPRAGEMIHELALAMRLKAKASVLADMIHAYPTYSEAVRVACSMVE